MRYTNKKIFGRVFHSKGKKDVGLVVPPNSKDFEWHLEKGIIKLVKLLNDRDYPTISSCQGHGLFCKRRVAICFPSYMKFLIFKMLVDELKIPYLRVDHLYAEEFYQVDGKYNGNAVNEINHLLGQDWKAYSIGWLVFDYDFDNEKNFVYKIGRVRKLYRQLFHLRKDYKRLIHFLQKKLLPLGLLE